MSHNELKQRVCKANLALVESGLVILNLGNASGIDREFGVVAIKSIGVADGQLGPEHIVLVSLDTGQVIDGTGEPSSDMPTHLHLYREYPALGGIIHTHSTYATAFAQAMREIPCYGTTQAAAFYGAIPLTRPLTTAEIKDQYETNAGKVIVERFGIEGIDPVQVPGVLVCNHGPFAWGPTVEKALGNAIILEAAAKMAWLTQSINPQIQPIPKPLLDKHFLRKHGAVAYDEQK